MGGAFKKSILTPSNTSENSQQMVSQSAPKDLTLIIILYIEIASLSEAVHFLVNEPFCHDFKLENLDFV